VTPGRKPAAGGRGRPRQADIARLTGVSQTTVSLVLNGNKAGLAIAKETRDRVLETARSLGYVPDPIARRLSQGQNNLLGLYTFTATFPTDVRHSYYPFLVGIEEEATSQGYDLLLFTSAATAEAGFDDVINRIRLADGCLFLGRHVPEQALGRFLEDGYPLVYIGRHDELGERLPYVGADYVLASAEVVRRLVGLGHRRMIYLRENDDAPASADREAGALHGRGESGLPAGALTVIRTDGADIGADRLRGWLRDGVTAVLVEETDTNVALQAAMAAAAAARLRYPEDFSLAVLGDPPTLPGQPVPSGFAVPRREMGAAAVRMLASLIDGAAEAGTRQVIACPAVSGQTTGPPPLPATR
jgi:DNA-binding LacI/PurR family transcriptional regulator